MWKPETILAPWWSGISAHFQPKGCQVLSKLWESRRVDLEREVCFVIACVAFSTGSLDVRDLKYDELVMEIGIVNSQSESQIRRSG